MARSVKIDTVEIVDPDNADEVRIINSDDYNPAVHILNEATATADALEKLGLYRERQEAAEGSDDDGRSVVADDVESLTESEVGDYGFLALREWANRYNITDNSLQGLLDKLRAGGYIVADESDG